MQDFKKEFYFRAYNYSVRIVRFVSGFQRDPYLEVLGKQLIRSATSITANLIEAKSASSKKDYINFYTHSLKSANETKLWVCLIRDTREAYKPVAKELLRETVEISNILAKSIITLKKKK